jgi:glycine cleavage system transcriptional repressor
MSHWVAITVLGQDRPGIVAGVTKALFEHGCNLEDSSATRLRDAFAMILIAELPEPPGYGELAARLAAVAEELAVSVDLRDLGGAAPQPPPAGRRCQMTVYGADQPGIVYGVAQALAGADCNVTDIATRKAGAVYVMMLEMTAPETLADADLEAAAARLRRALAVDVTWRAVEEETL